MTLARVKNKDQLDETRHILKGVPAKVLATELDPSVTRAKLRIERRGLQMVCRLLAFNAEAWLAEHFDVYLSDPDEYRAIMRNLLHLPDDRRALIYRTTEAA